MIGVWKREQYEPCTYIMRAFSRQIIRATHFPSENPHREQLALSQLVVVAKVTTILIRASSNREIMLVTRSRIELLHILVVDLLVSGRTRSACKCSSFQGNGGAVILACSLFLAIQRRLLDLRKVARADDGEANAHFAGLIVFPVARSNWSECIRQIVGVVSGRKGTGRRDSDVGKS